MKKLFLISLASLCFITQHSYANFIDGFEICGFNPTVENPTLSSWANQHVNSNGVLDNGNGNYDTTASGIAPLSGGSCLMRIEGIGASYNGFRQRPLNMSGINCTSSSDCGAYSTCVSGYCTSAGYSSAYSHFATYVKDLNAYQFRPIGGYLMNTSDKGCFATFTETTETGGQTVNYTNPTERFAINLFFKDFREECDAGSRNPHTACTSDASGNDIAGKCAETTKGEARCGYFPIGGTTVSTFACTGDGITECVSNNDCENNGTCQKGVWHHIGVDQINAEDGSANITCALTINGRTSGTSTRKAGTCTADGWACASNADCQSGAYNGRCSGWNVYNPYNTDETTQRCRTSQTSPSDCETCNLGTGHCTHQTSIPCTIDANCYTIPANYQKGIGSCILNTCNVNNVGPITQTWIGPNYGPEGVAKGKKTYDMAFDDWMVKSKGPNPGIIRTQYIPVKTQNVGTHNWTRVGCLANQYYNCVLNRDATYLSGNTNGYQEDFYLLNNTITLDINSPCVGETSNTPGTCQGDSTIKCFDDSDCDETFPINSPLTIVGNIKDQGEDGGAEQAPNKAVTFSVWPTPTVPTSTNCTNNANNCIRGKTVIVGDNINANTNFKQDGESAFPLGFKKCSGNGTTSCDSNANCVGNGTCQYQPWTESQLENLGVKFVYSGEPATQRQIFMDYVAGVIAISKPKPYIPRIVEDVNDDGFLTLCNTGDSTWNDSLLDASLASNLFQFDNILMQAAGGRYGAELLPYLKALMDGSGNSCVYPDCDPGEIPFNIHSKAVKGLTCNPNANCGGATGIPCSQCKGCDIYNWGMGINDVGSPGFAQHWGKCWAPRTGFCSFQGICTSGKTYKNTPGSCINNADCEEHGDPCYCPRSSAFDDSDPTTGFCIENYSTFGQTKFKTQCSSTDPYSVCSNFPPQVSFAGLVENTCYVFAVPVPACIGNWWGAHLGSVDSRCLVRSGSCDKDGTCNTGTHRCATGNHIGQACDTNEHCNTNKCIKGKLGNRCTTHVECNEVNLDCNLPASTWCRTGCINAPECTTGVCAIQRNSYEAIFSDHMEIIKLAKERNSNKACLNGSRTSETICTDDAFCDVCTGDQTTICTSDSDCLGNGTCDTSGSCVGLRTDNVYLMFSAEQAGTVPNGYSPNSSNTNDWKETARGIEVDGRYDITVAKANSLRFTDNNRWAKRCCPDSDTGRCTRDGIHLDINGVECYTEMWRNCFENIQGKTYGVCDTGTSTCTDGNTGFTPCSSNIDCALYSCDWTTTTTLP